ncbi:hypothetical protein GCM10020295_76650 [Streptomyces cinereospinus]
MEQAQQRQADGAADVLRGGHHGASGGVARLREVADPGDAHTGERRSLSQTAEQQSRQQAGHVSALGAGGQGERPEAGRAGRAAIRGAAAEESAAPIEEAAKSS